jgi:hypothetical protein
LETCAVLELTSCMGFEVIIINLILAIPAYFICRSVFKRLKNDKTRKWTTWLTTIALTPILYVGLIFFWIITESYYPEREFSKEKWKTDEETRYEMTDDLIENEKLIGKTKEQVKELLGQGSVSFDGTVWTYSVGYRPGIIVIDPDVFEVQFKDDKVIKCWTRRT